MPSGGYQREHSPAGFAAAHVRAAPSHVDAVGLQIGSLRSVPLWFEHPVVLGLVGRVVTGDDHQGV